MNSQGIPQKCRYFIFWCMISQVHTQRQIDSPYTFYTAIVHAKFQLCPTLWDPMDYTVHGILQARILERVAIFSSPGDLPNPGIEPRSPDCRWILYQLSHKGSPRGLTGAIKEISAAGEQLFQKLLKDSMH